VCQGCCYLSMNGCREGHEQHGRARKPVGTIETRTLAAVASPAMAMYSLNIAISDLKSEAPFGTSSGIVRVQVPIEEQVEAIDWLHSQNHLLLPRCFFSGRKHSPNGEDNLVSVAGLGSAVFFSQPHPFSYWDWISIRRYQSLLEFAIIGNVFKIMLITVLLLTLSLPFIKILYLNHTI